MRALWGLEMLANQIGFIVRHTVQDASGRFHVIGRCGDAPIRVGDTFSVLHVPNGVANDKPSIGDARPVQLKIVGIQAYQRNLSELGGGMTASIDLEGSGADELVPDAILEPPVRPNGDQTPVEAKTRTQN
jgi:hypothetical protein